MGGFCIFNTSLGGSLYRMREAFGVYDLLPIPSVVCFLLILPKIETNSHLHRLTGTEGVGR